MCFSAEVSFTAAAVLSFISYLTFKQISSQKQLLLACIPSIFAFQQFSEGVLWLFLRNNLYPSFWADIFMYCYLTCAFMVWPILFPLSIFYVEIKPARKQILSSLVIVGTLVALTNAIHATLYGVTPEIVFNRIYYNLHLSIDPIYYNTSFILYAASILLSFFVSTLKNTYLLGVTASLTLFAALYFYEYAYISVWCFFGAIFSILILKLIKDNPEYDQTQKG